MHYKNGRVAQVGDGVVGKDWNGQAVSGVVVKTQPGATTCNIVISPVKPNECLTMTSGECMHVDDALATPQVTGSPEPSPAAP